MKYWLRHAITWCTQVTAVRQSQCNCLLFIFHLLRAHTWRKTHTHKSSKYGGNIHLAAPRGEGLLRTRSELGQQTRQKFDKIAPGV